MINSRTQERERGLNIYCTVSTDRGNCGLSYTDHGGDGIRYTAGRYSFIVEDSIQNCMKHGGTFDGLLATVCVCNHKP